jgi:rubrerythrin
MENKNLEYLIDRAIKNEEDAYEFYLGLFNSISDAEAKDALKLLANEEKKHKEFLESYKSGAYKTTGLRMNEVIDYKIAQYIDKPDIDKNMKSKDVYLVAAHRELNSYNFYKGLSDLQPAGEVKEMLLKMASEEMKHKEKVEYLYTNTAFPQTYGG